MTDFGGTYSRAVSLFVAGKTDNEKLASLLIIAKLLKEQETDQLTRRKIFEKIGFDFINRLLVTESPDSEALSSVAVAILSSYCSDPELALHPQITSKLPYFNKFVSSKVCSAGVVNDSLYCIEVFVSVDKGRQYLWKYNTLLSLIQCFINCESHREVSKRIIISLLADLDQVKSHTDLILESVQYLTNEIKFRQCELKFELCQLLHDINQWIGEYLTYNKWLVDIGSALSDILHSRLDVAHRHVGLMLLCSLCQVHGCHWLLEVTPKAGKSKSSFILLAVHLTSIEINILLETDSISSQASPVSCSTPSLSLLISCFSFIEQSIVFVADSSEEKEEEQKGRGEKSLPSEEDLLQLHSTLLEAMTNIIKLLQRITKDLFENDETCATEQNPFLLPAIRVFGAWLAEDSLSLMSEASQLIPYLIQYCDNDKGGGVDIIKFLVPGFMNLIHQSDVPSIDEKLIGVLLKYATSLSTRLDDVTEQSQLQMCVSLMISVCEKEEEKKKELTGPLWTEWLRILSQLIKNTFVKDFITQTIVLYFFILKLTTKQDLVIGDIKSYIDILMKLSCNCLTLETNSSCSNITQLTQDITTKEKRVRSSDTKGRTDLVEPASSQNIDCHMLQLGLKQLSVLVSVNHEMKSLVTECSSLPSLQQLYNNHSEGRGKVGQMGMLQLDEDIDQFVSSVNILLINCKR